MWGKLGGVLLGSLGAAKNAIIVGAGGLLTWAGLAGPNSMPQNLLANIFSINQTAGAEAGVAGGFQGFYKLVEMLSDMLKSWGVPADGMGNWARAQMNDIPSGQHGNTAEELGHSLSEVGSAALEAVPYVNAVREFQQGDVENGLQSAAADTGGLAGAWVGAQVGGGLGAFAGGWGAIPGAIIGGTVGFFAGEQAVNGAWEFVHGFFQAPAPEPTRTAVLENMDGQFSDAVNNRVATVSPQHRSVFSPQLEPAVG